MLFTSNKSGLTRVVSAYKDVSRPVVLKRSYTTS